MHIILLHSAQVVRKKSVELSLGKTSITIYQQLVIVWGIQNKIVFEDFDKLVKEAQFQICKARNSTLL